MLKVTANGPVLLADWIFEIRQAETAADTLTVVDVLFNRQIHNVKLRTKDEFFTDAEAYIVQPKLQQYPIGCRFIAVLKSWQMHLKYEVEKSKFWIYLDLLQLIPMFHHI